MVIPRSGSISANIANVYEDYEGSVDSSIIAATGIGTSLYTIVGNALSSHFGKTIVPTEGNQVTLQEITPYLGLTIPEPTPTPIPVEGDIQVFKDAACTEYATGELSKVYVRINKNFGYGDSTTYHALEQITFEVYTPTSENPDDPYSLEYRVNVDNRAASDDLTTPFESGDIIEVDVVSSDLGNVIDFTNLPHIFGA